METSLVLPFPPMTSLTITIDREGRFEVRAEAYTAAEERRMVQAVSAAIVEAGCEVQTSSTLTSLGPPLRD
jgi:hypothetical protein